MATKRKLRISKERAKELLTRIRSTDPLHHYKPGPTALRFHYSNAYYRLLSGGGRSGKSNSAAADLAMVLRGIHPVKKWNGPVTAMVFCISRQQASMVVQKKLFHACEWPDLPGNPPGLGQCPFIPNSEMEDIGEQKSGFSTVYSASLKNGSKVWFAWSGVEDVWKKIQGTDLDYIYIDENAGNMKLLIEGRKRLMARQHPGRWNGCMVWAATGTEVNDAFEDYRSRCLDPEDKDHEYFQIQPGENPAVTPEALARLKATMSDEEWKVHGTGERTAASTVQIYAKQWDDNRHMLKSDYVIKSTDNLWLAYDPGVDHPTGMLIAAINPENPITLNVTKCWSHRHQTDDYDLRCLEQYLCGRRLAGIVYDTAASNTNKQGSSLISIMIEKMQARGILPLCGFFKSIKGHFAGISLVRHYLSPDAYSNDVPALIQVSPSEPSGGQLLRYQMMAYRGKEETKFTGAGGVVKKNDDLIDCLRYLTCKRPAYNPAWICGHPTSVVVQDDLPPVVPTSTTPPRDLSNYERHLSLSKARTKRGQRGLRLTNF